MSPTVMAVIIFLIGLCIWFKMQSATWKEIANIRKQDSEFWQNECNKMWNLLMQIDDADEGEEWKKGYE